MALADHILMDEKTRIDLTSGHEMLSVLRRVPWHINEADTHLLSIQGESMDATPTSDMLIYDEN